MSFFSHFFLGNLLSLIFLVPIVLLVVLWIRTPVFISSRGKHFLLWLKLGIVSLFLLALLDPKWQIQTIQESSRLIFAVDISASVHENSLNQAFQEIASICQNLPPSIEPRIVAFDGKTTVLDPSKDETLKQFDVLHRIPQRFRKEASSNIGLALEKSKKQISSGQLGRILLFSDGLDTHGEVENVLSTLSDENIPVSVFPLEVKKDLSSPKIIRMVFPDQIYVGEETKACALIYQPVSKEVELAFTGTDGFSQHKTVNLEVGLNVQSFSFRAKKVGPHVYSVTAKMSDSQNKSSTFRKLTQVLPLPRVMVFENSSRDGQFFRETLKAEQIDFVSFAPGSWPSNLSSEIMNYPCIVLNNIPKSEFRDSDLSAISDGVKEGNGLMMIGGPNSFGMGEYTDTPIEEALPVNMPRRTINQPLALVLLLDCSGSMFGKPWEYLVEAAKELIHLAKGHYIGVLLFSHAPRWVCTIQKIDNPKAACSLLDREWPGGGTVFSDALAEAFVRLKSQPFSQRSIIMMSDGAPSDFLACQYLFEHFRKEKISVTTMAVGFNVNQDVLYSIAHETGGEYYQSLEFSELPNLFKKEFKRISGPPYIEETFQPFLTNDQTIARGITQNEIPGISGLVITHPKKQASVVMANDRGNPILAYWQYGLGRGVVFTPDLFPKWTKFWASWQGYGKLIRQTIKYISEGAKQNISISLVQKGIDVSLKVDPGSNQKTKFHRIKILSPNGKSKTYALNLNGEGFYEASFSCPTPGLYSCQILDNKNQIKGESPLPVNLSNEFSPGQPNLLLLKHIAERTGGEFSENQGSLKLSFIKSSENSVYLPFWPVFAVFGLLLYGIDICVRKLNIFGISDRSELKDSKEASSSEIYVQLAQKFSNMAEEHALKGEEGEAKRYYLRAKAFFMKAQSVNEANKMWERYKRFEKK